LAAKKCLWLLVNKHNPPIQSNWGQRHL